MTTLKEWVDPGPPCIHCGKPQDSHCIRFVKKSKARHIKDDDEWVDHDIVNAEDHEFAPKRGHKELQQHEAEAVGFDVLSGTELPDDIYDRIAKVRERQKRVGPNAGKLKLVKTFREFIEIPL